MGNINKAYKIIGYSISAYLALVLLVYIYYTFEPLGDQPGITISEALWLTLLNPTGLTGEGLTMPVSLPGKTIAVIFVIFSIGLFSLFIGKISDEFTEYREDKLLGLKGTNFTDHFVIIGWDDKGKMVADELLASGRRVAIITNSKKNVENIYVEYSRKNVFTLFTQFSNIDSFKRANIHHAKRVLINEGDDTAKLVMCLNVMKHFQNLELVVPINNTALTETFYQAGVKHIVQNQQQATHLMASHIYEPGVAEFTNDLITSLGHNSNFELQQFVIKEGNKFINKRYGEMFRQLVEKYHCLPVSLSKKTSDGKELIMVPGDDVKVSKGDYVVLIVSKESGTEIATTFKVKQGE